MSENIKVNFMISESSKERLEQIKKSTKFNNSAIVDSLLQFDQKGLEFYIEQFANINNLQNYNYRMLDKGGVVLNKTTMDKVINSNISLYTEEEAVQKGIKAIDEKYGNSAEPNKTTDEKFVYHEKIILTLHRNIQSLENKLNDKIKFIEGMSEKLSSETVDNIKKSIVNDEELVEHIATLALKKLKNNI